MKCGTPSEMLDRYSHTFRKGRDVLLQQAPPAFLIISIELFCIIAT